MKNKQTPLLFVLGMPVIFILANTMAYFNIKTLGGSHVYISVFMYPLTLLISGLIIKKTNYKNAITVMTVSLACAAIAYIIQWTLLNSYHPFVMIYSFLSFLFCQLIFIYAFNYLIAEKKYTYFRVFLIIAFVLGIDHAFFGTIIEKQIISQSILIRCVYCVILPLLLAKKTTKTEDNK